VVLVYIYFYLLFSKYYDICSFMKLSITANLSLVVYSFLQLMFKKEAFLGEDFLFYIRLYFLSTLPILLFCSLLL